ncbi:hypothetical protein NQ176_g3982 [Zarea fungicola]|uniref:Uncharacterized protein n=1 Tax=Zarea fungicola TaxID=93591 RepID=A0ACC1NGV0_9HYPO|nr:hypothetical protein NQ176_g3982 [Lecanicillium fungicola]
MAFMPDMNLVTASSDGTLRITNPATKKTVAKLELEGVGSNHPQTLVVAGDSTIISIWGLAVHIWLPGINRITSYRFSSVRRTEGFPLAISADGKYILCWSDEGFDIMDSLSGATVAECPGGELVTSAAFSADGSAVLLGRIDGFLEVWDISRPDISFHDSQK